MIIVDAHQDIAWNTACYGRDYRISAVKHRENEIRQTWDKAMLGLPDAMLGRVGIVFSTLFAMPAKSNMSLAVPYPNPNRPIVMLTKPIPKLANNSIIIIASLTKRIESY